MTRVFVWSVIPIALLMLSLEPGRAQVQGTTFTVKSTADTVDAKPGDGICADSCGNCTLRAAIMEANAFSGDDTIDFEPSVFNVPQTIKLSIPGVNEDSNATGDLDIDSDLTIKGPGASLTTIDAGGIDRVLDIRWENKPKVHISGLTATGGKTLNTQPGGGSGGGILTHATGTLLTLINVTVSGNTADYGGGIFVGGSVTLNNCTVSGNSAFSGGGINNYINGPLTLNNSTVSGNSAGYGGGIGDSDHGPTLTLNNCTVSGNTTPNGAGMGLRSHGTVILKNTTLANTAGLYGNCDFITSPPFNGNLISLGHNLSTDNSCTTPIVGVSGGLNQTTDLNNTPAQLAPLALNVPGRTKTHALCTGPGAPVTSCLAASPAIDKGGDCLAVDQRGVPRPQGAACDIGAYEVGAAPTGSCVNPPPGLKGWWPLDETTGTTAADIIGSHNGTALPGPIGAFAGSGPVTSASWPQPPFPPGKVGTSLFFDGNRRVEVPHDSALEPGTGDFTIDAWVFYAAVGNGRLLTVAQKNTGATAAFGNTLDGWRFVIRDSSPTQGLVSFRGSLSLGGSVEEPITPNTWHHVSATLSTTNGFRIVKNYVDGVSSGQVGLNGNITSTAPLLIGGDGIGGGPIAVDELEIFNRALTQPEIQATFNAGSAGKCKTVVSPNQPPVANAGQTVEATSPSGASLTLDGSGSSDPDSDPLTYNWIGPFGAVSGVSPTVTLPLGTHTVTLKVNDGQATATDTVNITVRDTTAPDTITSSPVDGNGAAVASGGSTPSPSITFTFGGTDAVGVAGFQCSRDGSAYASCSSPVGYSALAIGSYVFRVRALDAAGNVDASPASITWTVVTPAQAIQNLMITIGKMGLPAGVANGLSGPLGQASKLLTDNNPKNDNAACGKLNDFIKEVNARVKNGKLTTAQASQLLTAANAIKAGLGC